MAEGDGDGATGLDRPKEPEEMTALERAAFAERCREIGSRGFKAGDWQYAALAYSEGLRYLEYEPHDGEMQPDPSFDHGGKAQLDKDMALAVTLFSNLAAVTLKLEEPRDALDYAEKALRFDPRHAKAALHRANALLALGDYQAAKAAAQALEPEISAKVAAQAERALREAKRQEKAFFSKMLNSSAR
ncbi:unnamed protein product [Effrenium voratum]|uniref:peptidylprolyl isomerase n=1 Tax=Effrenium voratum TaxID=2562239 RepID=A0AA36MQ93_9DINO|nr:unnamed protein product [Effrenium voratum]